MEKKVSHWKLWVSVKFFLNDCMHAHTRHDFAFPRQSADKAQILQQPVGCSDLMSKYYGMKQARFLPY
jgi:hypothetical protein